jgi:hypothetical protein
MPLVTEMTGNTPATIHECLGYLSLNSTRNQRKLSRVSIVFGSGESQVRVGDDLEVADFETRKVHKKRWWERYDTSQLKLPFALFLPAKILALDCCDDPYENMYRLLISYKDSDNIEREVVTRFDPDSWPLTSSFGIKAIRVHRIVDQPEDRAHHTVSNAVESCIQLANRAASDGVVVTRCCDIYNKITGAHVGYDLSMIPECRLTMDDDCTALRPLRGSFRLLTGSIITCHISSVDYIDADTYDVDQRSDYITAQETMWRDF